MGDREIVRLKGYIERIRYIPKRNLGILDIEFYEDGRITPIRRYQARMELSEIIRKEIREDRIVEVDWERERDCIRKVHL